MRVKLRMQGLIVTELLNFDTEVKVQSEKLDSSKKLLPLLGLSKKAIKNKEHIYKLFIEKQYIKNPILEFYDKS